MTMFYETLGLSPHEFVGKLVAAGQCLLPLEPKPTAAQIRGIIAKLGAAFDATREMQEVAILEWCARIGVAPEGVRWGRPEGIDV
jgi:hypothetical protein